MTLADRLNQPPAGDARRARESHPQGWEPGAKFDACGVVEANVRVSAADLPAISQDEQRWREEIARVTGMPIPDERQVQLTDTRYWGDSQSPYVYCRFKITDRAPVAADIDGVALLKALRPRKVVKTAFTGDTTLCMSINDLQTGKLAGGGTEALAERLDSAYDAVRDRARELRKIGRNLGALTVIGGGDLIEGCGSIFPNQAHEIDSDRRAQIRNTVTFILEGLDRLAPLFERVNVLAVGGNHGENRINGNRTTRHDNDDCAVFEHVALAASRDPRLGHVNFVIAQDEPAKTLDVNGWILGTTHGHVFGKNISGSVEQKAWNWFRNQAAGRQPVGDSDVLITHHYHHFASRDWGAALWVQTPAMDGGSPFFTDFSGQSSEAGLLTWVMSPEKRFVDPQIV